MGEILPDELRQATELFTQFQTAANHDLKISNFEQAVKILDKCGIGDVDAKTQEYIANLRLSNTRVLLNFLGTLTQPDPEIWVRYMFLLIFRMEGELGVLVSEYPELMETFKKFEAFVRKDLLEGCRQFVENSEQKRRDVEDLMNDLLPIAEDKLSEQGEFFPFGGAIENNGNVVHLGVAKDARPASSKEFVKAVQQELQNAAKNGKYIAVAIVQHVKVTAPNSEEKIDAIQIRLDHEQNYSVEVFFPFEITEDNKLMIGEAFARDGKALIYDL